MILGIQDFFIETLSKMLYGLVQGFLTILYWLERVFKILAGVEPIPGGNGQDSYNILDSILGDTVTAKLLAIFMFLGLATFLISLCVGIIRANTKKDSPAESKKVLSTAFKALFYFVFIPALFIVATQIIGQIMNITVNSVASTITGSGGASGATTAETSIANTLFMQMFDAKDRADLSKRNANFLCSYEQIEAFGPSMKFSNTSFQYVILTVVSAIMFWTLGIATIGLAERIINVIILYLLAPIMIGSSPLDGGQRLNIWKDKVLVKLFGAMGNILSMYIFLLVLGVIGEIVSNNSTLVGEDSWILTCVYAVVCIAGAMMCCKGNALISSLISSQGGQEEGLSTMTTSQLAGQGLRIAGAGLSMVAGGAFAATKSLSNKGLGINNKAVGASAPFNGVSGGGMNASTPLAASGKGGNNPLSQSGNMPTNSNLLTNSSGSGANALQRAAAAGGVVGLGAGAIGLAAGAGKLLTSPISKVGSFAKDKAYQKKMNTTSDGKKLSKDDPNRVSLKEARMARTTENQAKKAASMSRKTEEQQAKQKRINSIQSQARKRGTAAEKKQASNINARYRKNLDEKADSMIKKKYSHLAPAEQTIAKKEIISSMGGGRSNQSLDQKVQAAIKKAKNTSSPLNQVGQMSDGGKKE